MLSLKKGFISVQAIILGVILVATLGAVGIGIYYFSKPDDGDIAEQSLCGDGVCQDIEKENWTCEQDCGNINGKTGDNQTGKTNNSSGNGTATASEINFHYLATGKKFGNILKLFNPIADEQNRRLYVVGSKTTYVGVIDMDKDELIDSFDIGVSGGYLIFNNQKLYSYDFSANKCHEIDTVNKKASEVSISTCTTIVPKKGADKSVKWGNYSFKETGYQSFADGTTGFATNWNQDLNAAYGVIEIYDSSGANVGEITHGPDALYFTIDQKTGKLYTTNTGDGSVSIFDLNKLESTNYCKNNNCKIKGIDIGNSADEVIADSSGNLYVRNRLGGSVIYKYNLTSKSFTIIDNENHVANGISMWPTDIELSKDEKRLYVLSHYGALIDIIDTSTNKVASKIKFETSLKPRTDSISAMTVDKSRDRIYAVWPELGVIGVADGKNSKVLGTIDLTKYGFTKSKSANAGPGLVNLAVNEKTNKLYAYLYNEQKLLVFNGDSFAKEKDASLALKDRKELSLMSNDDKTALYLGNKIIDQGTLKEIGNFSKGKSVVAFNNENNAVYLSDMSSAGPGKAQEKVYEFNNNTLAKEWVLDKIGSIASRFHFNFDKNIFYTAYFESGRVKQYILDTEGTPNAGNTSPSSDSSQQPSDGKQPSGEQAPTGQKKCGDGVCDAVEKEKGVCSQDCE